MTVSAAPSHVTPRGVWVVSVSFEMTTLMARYPDRFKTFVVRRLIVTFMWFLQLITTTDKLSGFMAAKRTVTRRFSFSGLLPLLLLNNNLPAIPTTNAESSWTSSPGHLPNIQYMHGCCMHGSKVSRIPYFQQNLRVFRNSLPDLAVFWFFLCPMLNYAEHFTAAAKTN